MEFCHTLRTRERKNFLVSREGCDGRENRFIMHAEQILQRSGSEIVQSGAIVGDLCHGTDHRQSMIWLCIDPAMEKIKEK